MGMATKVALSDLPKKRCPICNGPAFPLFNGHKQKVGWCCIVLTCGHVIEEEKEKSIHEE